MRKYIPGDDPKRINWKASARYNELIVNETEAERVTDVMIVLDTDVTMLGPTESELFEREVQAAASLTRQLLSQGNRVGLVLQGGERGSIPAGFGKRHERRILYLLAAAKPGRATVSTSYVMNLLARRMLPSRSQIVIISPLLDPELREGVKQLTIAGYSMLILSPSPTPPTSVRDQTEEIAFKFIMLERSFSLLPPHSHTVAEDQLCFSRSLDCAESSSIGPWAAVNSGYCSSCNRGVRRHAARKQSYDLCSLWKFAAVDSVGQSSRRPLRASWTG